MFTEQLWKEVPGLHEETPVLECYLPENKTSDVAVVIFPGGGYHHRAVHEGAGYAEFLNANGIAAFVCQYRVSPHTFPLPLLDARRAVRYVRHHSARFGIDPKKVYVMGSSAGGHLAAVTSTYTAPIEFENQDEIDQEAFRPDGQSLCYPVIKLLGKPYAALGSGKNLLDNRQAELGEELSPDRIADSQTPRAFIWHTFDDGSVHIANTLDYAKRLREVHVPAEIHIYPHGRHGLGLAESIPYVARWSECLLRWLNEPESSVCQFPEV